MHEEALGKCANADELAEAQRQLTDLFSQLEQLRVRLDAGLKRSNTPSGLERTLEEIRGKLAELEKK